MIRVNSLSKRLALARSSYEFSPRLRSVCINERGHYSSILKTCQLSKQASLALDVPFFFDILARTCGQCLNEREMNFICTSSALSATTGFLIDVKAFGNRPVRSEK